MAQTIHLIHSVLLCVAFNADAAQVLLTAQSSGSGSEKKKIVNFNVIDPQGETPLHIAARCGSIGTIAKLCAQNVKKDFKDKDGYTPLHRIIAEATKNSYECFKTLVYSEPRLAVDSLNIQTKTEKYSPLHLAVKTAQIQIIEELCSLGVSLELIDATGKTPLELAGDLNRKECADILSAAMIKKKFIGLQLSDRDITITSHGNVILLEQHSRVLQNSKESKQIKAREEYETLKEYVTTISPFVKAVIENNALEVKRIISDNREVLQEVDAKGNTALHYAAGVKSNTSAYILLEAGANPNATNNECLTAVHCAILSRNIELLNVLKGYATNFQVRNNSGESVLHYAARLHNLAVLEFCITVIQDINETDVKGYSAVHYAALHGDIDAAKKLISTKASFDLHASLDGCTPLHLAALSGNEATVKFLSECGADAKRLDREGRTLLHYAILGGTLTCVAFCIEKGICKTSNNDTSGGINYATLLNHKDIADFLRLQNSNAVEISDDEADKPLQLSEQDCELFESAETNNFENALKALQDGADPSAKNYVGCTPLHIAALKGNSELVKKMVEFNHRALSERDNRNALPIHLAALRGHTDTVAFLMKQPGYNPHVPGLEDKTPYELAKESGNISCAELLKK